MKFLSGPKGVLVLFDYSVSLLAIIANCLVLESVLKVHFDLTGYRRFLISLAISDLYICGVNLLTFIHATYTMYASNPQMEKCGADFLRSLQFVGFFANLFNLCGMSVDHFIGIVYPLRYCDLMNKQVTKIAVVAIWVTSFVLGFADFPIATALYLSNNFEQASSSNDFNFPLNGGHGGFDWNAGISGLGGIYGGDAAASAAISSANHNDSGLSETLELVKQPLFSKGVDNGFSSETTPNNPLALFENFPGLLSDEFVGALQLNDNGPIPQSVITDISILMNNGSGSGSGSGEENVEKTLYEEILKIVQHKKESVDWCTFYLSNKVWLEFSVMSLTLVCFVFLIICYGRIFKEVFMNIDPSERNTRKLVITTFLLLGAFTICWMPFMIFEFTMVLVLRVESENNNTRTLAESSFFLVIHNIFNSMLMCYPLVDPVIYAARMRVVQRYILVQYGRFFPCFRGYVRRMTDRRTSIFTYALTSSNYANGQPSKSGSSPSLNGTSLNTHANSRLFPGSANDFGRQYSITDSAFTKRESVTALSGIVPGGYANESPEEEQPNYIIKSPGSSHHHSPARSVAVESSESSSPKKSPHLTGNVAQRPEDLNCPPLIYRNSFKRQIRQMYAMKQATQDNNNGNVKKPEQAKQEQSLLGAIARENVSNLSASVEALHINNNKSSSRREPTIKSFFGTSASTDDPVKAFAFFSKKGSRRRLKSHSSYQIPLNLVEGEVTPCSSESTMPCSIGASSATSSSVPSGADDSSARLLQGGDDSDTESLSAAQQQPQTPLHHLHHHHHHYENENYCDAAHHDGAETTYMLLRQVGCPCSEFANSQAVVDKFRDNSLRLLGAGTLGPDHSSLSQTSSNDTHQLPSLSSSDETPSSTSRTPIKTLKSYYKSPTMGDFSSPNDDLFSFHSKNDNTNNNNSNNNTPHL